MSSHKKSQNSKRRGHGRRSSKSKAAVTSPAASAVSSSMETPSFVEPCDKLLKQVTVIDDCKPFIKNVSTHDPIYKEHHKLIANPVSFKTVRDRLHEKPCAYQNYDEFAADVKKIFDQEQRLKAYKGSSLRENIQKRMLMANRARNYWKTLIAPYEQYGFDAVQNHQRNSQRDSDVVDDEEEDDDHKTTTTSEQREEQPDSKKRQQAQKKVLSNLKKRVQRSELPPMPPNEMEMMAMEPPASKRRRLNAAAHAKHDKAEKEDGEDEEEEEEAQQERKNGVPVKTDEQEKEKEKVRDPLLLCYDTPFTPFAAKSRVFRQMMGSTSDVFGSANAVAAAAGHGPRDQNGNVKKQLHFIPSQAMYENNLDAPQTMYEFKIKFKNYDRLFKFREPTFYECAAPRMEVAVDMFRKTHENCNIISVTMGSLDD